MIPVLAQAVEGQDLLMVLGFVAVLSAPFVLLMLASQARGVARSVALGVLAGATAYAILGACAQVLTDPVVQNGLESAVAVGPFALVMAPLALGEALLLGVLAGAQGPGGAFALVVGALVGAGTMALAASVGVRQAGLWVFYGVTALLGLLLIVGLWQGFGGSPEAALLALVIGGFVTAVTLVATARIVQHRADLQASAETSRIASMPDSGGPCWSCGAPLQRVARVCAQCGEWQHR